MHDITTDRISNSVWADRTFCAAAHWRSCLAATLSFVTVHSSPAQGGGEALITHLQSAANYCLLTGTDEPVATTTERWRGWEGGRNTWVEDGLEQRETMPQKLLFSHV